MMYQPLKFFTYVSLPPILVGLGIGIRFIYYLITAGGAGHIQSLILACTLIIIGFLTFMIGMDADLLSCNRKILSDTQVRMRMTQYYK